MRTTKEIWTDIEAEQQAITICEDLQLANPNDAKLQDAMQAAKLDHFNRMDACYEEMFSIAGMKPHG